MARAGLRRQDLRTCRKRAAPTGTHLQHARMIPRKTDNTKKHIPAMARAEMRRQHLRMCRKRAAPTGTQPATCQDETPKPNIKQMYKVCFPKHTLTKERKGAQDDVNVLEDGSLALQAAWYTSLPNGTTHNTKIAHRR